MDHHPKTRLSEAAKVDFMQHCKMRQYRAHDCIIRPEHLMLIIEGAAVSKHAGHKQRYDLILETFNPGQFVGESGLFGAADPSDHYISVRSDALVGEIRSAKLQELLAGDLQHRAAEIMAVLAAQQFKRLQRMQRNYINALQLDVPARIAQLLLELAKTDSISHPEGRQIKITRQEIGQRIGCSREMAGRVLKKFNQHNLIDAHGKTIVIFGER